MYMNSGQLGGESNGDHYAQMPDLSDVSSLIINPIQDEWTKGVGWGRATKSPPMGFCPITFRNVSINFKNFLLSDFWFIPFATLL